MARRRVDEHLDVGVQPFMHPAREGLEPLLDQVVVVAALRIDADRGAVAPRQGRQRIGFPLNQLTPEGLAHDVRLLRRV